jgi:hypothetical protein
MRAGTRALCAAIALAASVAQAQPAAAPCPANGLDLPVEALYGNWQLRLEGVPGTAVVRFEKHPDYAGVRGTVRREDGANPATTAQLAGDIDNEGLLSIDESIDGHSISGVWLGELQPGSCGKAFKGTWRNALDDSTRPFILNKTDGRP